jgi:thiamine biosynthesis lipoprotein
MHSKTMSIGIILALASSAIAQTPGAKHLVTRNGSAMGTAINVSVYTDDEPRAEEAIRDAFAEIARIEALMTTWHPSEVTRINDNAGYKPVAVSDDTLAVIEKAQWASKLSGGAFDITFYAMHGLWKFDEDMEKDPRLPDAKEIARRKALIDWRQVVVDHDAKTVFLKKKGMGIGLGGIAKGYAVDRAGAVLKQHGFANAIVQAGGDLLCAGSKEGRPWSAGIQDPRLPREDPNRVFAVLRLEDHAFSTAGDYERYYFIGQKRYHHIIDPKTGYPATRSRSVTIYARDALTADALDDAVFILGWKKGLELIEKLDDVGAVVIDDQGETHLSSRVKDRIEIRHPPRNAP